MQPTLIESTQIAAVAAGLHTQGVLVVIPSTDLAMAQRAAALAASRAGVEVRVVVVLDTARLGLVRVHNEVFRYSQSSHYAYLAQDAFVGRDWLSLGLQALERENAALLGFNDGKWQGQLAAFGLARRDWVSSVYGGSFFFEGYKSHYADTELTLVAREQHRYAYEPNAVVMEVDWDKDTKPSTSVDDKSLFKARAKNGFGQRVTRESLLGLFS
jgi:hypothetical protein